MKIFVLFAFVVSVVSAQAQVRCGETPAKLYPCMGNPQVVNTEVSRQCGDKSNECDRMKCIFQKSGWLNGEKVDRQKVTAYFDDYAKAHPDWSTAVSRVKTDCLSRDLLAQGPFLNCPAYDVVHCALNAFIKNVQAHQWSTAKDCESSRQYAASCPLCPEDCFAAQIPYGSCNACYLLPRSP